LCGLPLIRDPKLIVGLEKADDAGVYQLTEDLAIIQTVDFFPPVVDDPYMFGQIAAANALSDVYAMGGRPLTAMNLVAFPDQTMSVVTLRKVIIGALDKLREAGVVLVGGHSLKDKELKYGLSVTGIVHPQKVITLSHACPGDKLVLTKPLGTGILSTALKAGVLGQDDIDQLIACMAALNKEAAQLMAAIPAHACTDITGFGLMGHAWDMARSSEVGVKIYTEAVPLLPQVAHLARDEKFIPPGTRGNREYVMDKVKFAHDMPEFLLWILFDAQTSGGLLISLSPTDAESMVEQLHQRGIAVAAIIGEVTNEPGGAIILS